jgi:hypothetical protein
MAQRKRVQLYSSCAIVCSAHDFILLLQIRYSAHKPFASFTNAILALLTQLPCVLSFRNIVGGRRRGGRHGHEGTPTRGDANVTASLNPGARHGEKEPKSVQTGRMSQQVEGGGQ